jgi:hypothetical protein
MYFVIKLSGPTGGSGWLSPPGKHDVRTIVYRSDAALFQNRDEADEVISQLHALKRAGIVFSVETAAHLV